MNKTRKQNMNKPKQKQNMNKAMNNNKKIKHE